MNSALYVGRVSHHRIRPVEHAFTYRHFFLYLDLDELDRVFAGRWLWSVERANLASLRRADLLGDRARPLADCVRDRVAAELGRRPNGPVRVATQPRLFGYAFNPVSFYFCYAEDGRTLDAVVAEITNTPWNERHAYVMDGRARVGSTLRARFPKSFHVSPFLPMDLEYAWELAEPGDELVIHMQDLERGECIFRTDLQLERRPITGGSLAGLLASFPGFSLRTVAAIYLQALRLKLKGAPFFDHPKWKAGEAGASL